MVLVSGYWQGPMAPASQEISAFSTPSGHYKWLKMPFRLKGASMTFQHLINDVYAGMLGKHVFTYLLHIIVTAKNRTSLSKVASR